MRHMHSKPKASRALKIGLCGLQVHFALTLIITKEVTVKAATNQSNFSLSGCTCIGSSLTFECTAVGAGATIWKGSAFNCPESSNEIQLLHSDFQEGSVQTCNNGQIVAHALDVPEDLHFRSRVDVQVSAAVNGTSVECDYDDGATVHSLKNSTIILTTEPLPPPMNIHMSNVSRGQLVFTWDPVAVTCPQVSYIIESINCGRCPSNTSEASVTCTDVEFDEQMCSTCTFAVSTVVCSNLVGTNKSIDVQLEVPNMVSSEIYVTPTYYNDTGHLFVLNTYFTKTVYNHSISSSHSAATSYTVTYTDSDTGKICGNAIISAESCVGGTCNQLFVLSSSDCLQPVGINVTIFGTNLLGDGKKSYPIKRDYINSFMEVRAIPETNTVLCKLFFKSGCNTLKSCQITFFNQSCQTEEILHLYGRTTADSVSLSLHSIPARNSSNRYCFMSSASNGTLTVNVTGTYEMMTNITPGEQDKTWARNIWAYIVAIVIVLVLMIVFLIVIVIAIIILSLCFIRMHKKSAYRLKCCTCAD